MTAPKTEKKTNQAELPNPGNQAPGPQKQLGAGGWGSFLFHGRQHRETPKDEGDARLGNVSAGSGTLAGHGSSSCPRRNTDTASRM